MKCLYIIGVDTKKYPEYKGIRKKIEGQIEAFKELGINMDWVDLYDDYIYLNSKNTNIKLKSKNDYIKYNEFYINLYKKNIIDIEKYDFIYIRFSMANIGCYKLVKEISKRNVKVIIEIPTYPYYDELRKNLKDNIRICIDKFIWKRYKKFIFRISVTNDLAQIYGVKTIQIFNGVNLNDINVSTSIYNNKTLNIIGVANISRWHGYDRILTGLSEYYKDGEKEVEIRFIIVGEGEEKQNLINLTKLLKMEKYVDFAGAKFEDELDELYNKANIGVSSLGLHRAGGGHDPIKSKEYIAKGIPVIISQKDRAISEKLDFVFKVNNDDSAVNFNEILNKYMDLKSSKKEIRDYAEVNLSWKSQMKKIIESLCNE